MLSTTGCKSCPSNAYCFGSRFIAPRPSFYRYDLHTDEIVKCVSSAACKGGLDKEHYSLNLTGNCAYPFEGRLCSKCQSGYALTSNQQSCTSCEDDWYFYLRFTAKVMLSLLIVSFELYRKHKYAVRYNELVKTGEEDSINAAKSIFDASAVIKILMTFSQMISIVNALSFNPPYYVEEFYGLTSNIVPSIVNEFSSNCLFDFLNLRNDQRAFYYNYLFGIATPFLFLLLFILIFAIRRFTTRKRPNPFPFKEMTQTTALIIFYLRSPEMLLETLKLFNCRHIGD